MRPSSFNGGETFPDYFRLSTRDASDAYREVGTNLGDRARIAAAASGDFAQTDFEWMRESDSQESVGGYFFPDLRPLAEFDAAYDPAETSNSYENAL